VRDPGRYSYYTGSFAKVLVKQTNLIRIKKLNLSVTLYLYDIQYLKNLPQPSELQNLPHPKVYDFACYIAL
jgi:hypothetical protein